MSSSEGSINVHDHGKSVDVKKQRVQCNYCGKVMSGFFRLKYHLGCVRGDVIPCVSVPEDVKKLFKDELQQSSRLGNESRHLFRQRNGCLDSNVAKKTRCQSSESYDGESGDHGNTDSMSEDDLEPATESTVIGDPNEESLSKQNKKCIGRFFFETGIDFKLVNSPSFQSMINYVHGPDHGFYVQLGRVY